MLTVFYAHSVDVLTAEWIRNWLGFLQMGGPNPLGVGMILLQVR